MSITREFIVDTIGRVHRQQEKILYLEAAFEFAGPTIVADVSGMVQIFNPAAEDLFGIERTLIEGQDNVFHLLESCLVGDDDRVDSHRLEAMLKTDQRIKNVRVMLKPLDDDRRTPALLTINYMRDKKRNPVGIVAQLSDNSEVERLTMVDYLTGLFNKAYFERSLRNEYARLDRNQVPMLSLVFLDVDDFGKFNKTMGHDAGDLVLQAVAKGMEAMVRTADTVCRFGGEEFVVILPATGNEDAKTAAERICAGIRQTKVDLGAERGTVSVTVSVGVSTHYAKSSKSTAEQLLRDADAAMREAKRAGKDRFVARSGQG